MSGRIEEMTPDEISRRAVALREMTRTPGWEVWVDELNASVEALQMEQEQINLEVSNPHSPLPPDRLGACVRRLQIIAMQVEVLERMKTQPQITADQMMAFVEESASERA